MLPKPIFTKLTLTAHLVVKELYTEFYENLPNDLVADAGFPASRQAVGLVDCRTWSSSNVGSSFPLSLHNV
jgi:hypothetical protein